MMKVIIDTDAGLDDAHAIMMALCEPQIEVIGITTVTGNVDLEKCTQNVLRVLQAADRLDIPVYKGACHPIITTRFEPTHYHGFDGLGDAEHKNDPDQKILVQEKSAVNAIIDIVNKYPGEISLIALAPLTNVALAHRIDPTISKKLKEVLIMGGSMHATGNIKVTNEFNFGYDPEAVYIVLEEFSCPMKMVPLETTYGHGLEKEFLEKWLAKDTKLGRFNQKISRFSVERYKELGLKLYTSHDAIAMTAFLRPEIIDKSEMKFCTMELKGEHTKGMLIVDWRDFLNRKPNVKLIMELNQDGMLSVFENCVK